MLNVWYADVQRLLSQHHRSDFSARMITQFAEEIGVAPGVVVGRLQHDGILPKSHLNKLKQRIVLLVLQQVATPS